MARDLDFIRDLLLKIDQGEKSFDIISKDSASMLGIEFENGLSEEEAQKLDQHLHLLETAGLIEIEFRSAGGFVRVKDITWSGYDFLDSVRDPEVWRRTKEGAGKMGGWTFDLLKDMGKAYLKHVAKERLGLDL